MAAARIGGRVSTQPASNIYTGLLGISLGAMITACVFLMLDKMQYPDKKPDLPPEPAAIKTPAPAGQPGAPGQPPAPGQPAAPPR
jgi:hypothetical protein